jgi:hypothetical protein
MRTHRMALEHSPFDAGFRRASENDGVLVKAAVGIFADVFLAVVGAVAVGYTYEWWIATPFLSRVDAARAGQIAAVCCGAILGSLLGRSAFAPFTAVCGVVLGHAWALQHSDLLPPFSSAFRDALGDAPLYRHGLTFTVAMLLAFFTVRGARALLVRATGRQRERPSEVQA